jgi:DNA polymerase-3 subunit delta'
MPFREIMGHRRILSLLARSIADAALPPSLLFAGDAGSPADDAAISVAQALNCLSRATSPESPGAGLVTGAGRPATDSCGICSACDRIARGVHPDVQIVEPGDAGTIRIEQIRDVVDRSAYRPFEGRRRVVIVREADMMVAAAQNALLKTLEEPPASSVFILVTSRPAVLLPTVRSRLIRLSFSTRGAAAVDGAARDVAQRVLTRVARSPDTGRQSPLDTARSDRGPADRSAVNRLDAAKDLLERTGAGGASDRDQLRSHLHALALMLRDVEVLGTGADPRLLAQPENRAALDTLTPAFRGERGVNAFLAVDRGLAALDRNAGVKVVADWVALQL